MGKAKAAAIAEAKVRLDKATNEYAAACERLVAAHRADGEARTAYSRAWDAYSSARLDLEDLEKP